MLKEKQRHGCLTIWLVLLIIGGVLSLIGTAVMYLVDPQLMRETFPDAPGWTVYAMGLISLFSFVFAIVLFTWKKWAFWGYVVTSIASAIVSITMGTPAWQWLLGLTGVVILYGVLQIGGEEKKGWTQLE
ncbi:hypothetical protein LM599_07445 [Candidatus Acetothermia bacterium]|jgi:FtsH-binding integral membrane protein|nr:hypothetical protein [Candidatus Acetothermia bacterium]MCI2427670.1 hypothetical protein [Candidatus Acetothermia bacterium]MCI2429004.1 hypothetical protein [Candidatus Acetothermia bacterium]